MRSLKAIFTEVWADGKARMNLILAIIFMIAAGLVKRFLTTANATRIGIVLAVLSVIYALNFYGKVDGIISEDLKKMYENGSPPIEKDKKS